MVELLAPAGQLDSGYAAFKYGADAVYLGLTRFSARAEAENFTQDDFEKFVRFAHSISKKVLVAVNTVFFEEEMPELIDTLQIIDSEKADGIIVQDIGTARLVKKYFPNLRLHGSTQMAVHNRQGVETLRDLGFKRVVLARELTLEEIKDICRVPDIEKEVFIHGALCYSYSGLCLFSSVYASRSANRGKCVYPCREAFHINGQMKHIFSMKDLAQNENVLSLEQAGVSALKIEGRKKSPLYVSAVTDYYRSLLNGEKNQKVLKQKQNDICCIFSRPTTDLYLTKKKNFDVVDPDVVGHRGLKIGKVEHFSSYGGKRYICFKTTADIERHDGIQIDLPKMSKPFGFSAQDIRIGGKQLFEVKAKSAVEIALPEKSPFIPVGAVVYLASSGAVKRTYPLEKPEKIITGNIKASILVSIQQDCVSAQEGKRRVCIRGSFSSAKSLDAMQKAVCEAFSKTGNTPVILENLKVENQNGLFVPLSVLNDLRRQLYRKICDEYYSDLISLKNVKKQEILNNEKPVFQTLPERGCSYHIKTDDAGLVKLFLQKKEPVDEFVFELNCRENIDQFLDMPKTKIRFSLPAVARKDEVGQLMQKAKMLYDAGFKKFEIANVWGLQFLKDKKVDMGFDWPIYVANSSAARAVLDTGASYFVVSPETPDPTDLFAAFPFQAQALIYRDLPLFVSETCPYAALNARCLHCSGMREEVITSKYGEFLSVMKNCRHFLLAKNPVDKKQEMLKRKARLLRIEFIHRKESIAKRLDIFHRLIY